MGGTDGGDDALWNGSDDDGSALGFLDMCFVVLDLLVCSDFALFQKEKKIVHILFKVLYKKVGGNPMLQACIKIIHKIFKIYCAFCF